MKIPDDVFETRCPYCIHGQTRAGNKDIPPAWVYQIYHMKDLSCKIFGVAWCDEIPGECRSFTPLDIFGICKTCAHFNQFHGKTGCLLDESPNRRQVYIGMPFGETYESELFTCDEYTVQQRKASHMVELAAQGKIPKNFDPETMEPIGRLEETKAAKIWEQLTDKARAEEEAARRAREEKNGQQIEFSLDDFKED